MLQSCRTAALELYNRVRASAMFIAPIPPQLDIVVWAVRGATIQESSARAQTSFDLAAERDLHLALVQMPAALFPAGTWPSHSSSATVTCLRSVLMKPEHLPWIDEIWTRLDAATQMAMRPSEEEHQELR